MGLAKLIWENNGVAWWRLEPNDILPLRNHKSSARFYAYPILSHNSQLIAIEMKILMPVSIFLIVTTKIKI